MDGRIEGLADWWMDGWTQWSNGWIVGRLDRRTEGLMYGWIQLTRMDENGRTVGWIDKQVYGRTVRRRNITDQLTD